MGVQLSANYSSIEQIFTIGLWKVHSAQRKTTGEKVSLWMLDQEKLSIKYKNKNEKEAFLDHELLSIINMKKLRHPHILKLLEVNDKKPDLAFAAEPVSFVLSSQIERMHTMDISYISLQVAEVMQFLNQDARLLHLNLCSENVLMSEDLSVKLFGFHYCFQITSNNAGLIPIPSFQVQFVNYYCKPPEFISGKGLSAASDIFVFGLFLYEMVTGTRLIKIENSSEIMGSIPTLISNLYSINPVFKDMILGCLVMDPSMRTSFSSILSDQCYQTMQMRSLKYIDLILTKNPADKFTFYKGLSQKISDFSPKIQQMKILPTLLVDCNSDVRFAPVVLGSILTICQSFDNDQFLAVWNKIVHLTTIQEPPEVLIAFIQNSKVILEKIDRHHHKDYVFPILISCLQSQNPIILKEGLQNVQLYLSEMNENYIRSIVIPRLLDIGCSSTDDVIVSKAIQSIAQAVPKMGADSFTSEMLPKISLIWSKNHNKSTAPAICEILEKLNATNDIIVGKAVPIAAEIAASHSITKDTRERICNWIIKSVTKLRDATDRQSEFNPLGNTDNNSTNADQKIENDNPFADPIPKKSIPAPIKEPPVMKQKVIDDFSLDLVNSTPPTKSNPQINDEFSFHGYEATSRNTFNSGFDNFATKPVVSNIGDTSVFRGSPFNSTVSNNEFDSFPGIGTPKPAPLMTNKSNEFSSFSNPNVKADIGPLNQKSFDSIPQPVNRSDTSVFRNNGIDNVGFSNPNMCRTGMNQQFNNDNTQIPLPNRGSNDQSGFKPQPKKAPNSGDYLDFF